MKEEEFEFLVSCKRIREHLRISASPLFFLFSRFYSFNQKEEKNTMGKFVIGKTTFLSHVEDVHFSFRYDFPRERKEREREGGVKRRGLRFRVRWSRISRGRKERKEGYY